MKLRGMEFPDALHYLIEHQVWARLEPGATGAAEATVGITALGIRVAGEIYMCRPKPVGTEVEQGRSIAVVELAKSIVSVKSPVHGSIVAVNPRLADEPGLVFADPYGAGWLARVRLSDFAADSSQLLHGAAVAPAMEHYAWQNRVEES